MSESLETEQERREYKRYKVKECTYAMDSARSGLVTDIGLGGMSLTYVERKNWPEDSFLLDIIIGEDSDVCLGKIPYRVICEEEHRDVEAESVKILKRRSIAFGDLSDEQLENLKNFIVFNTIAEA